MKLLVNRTDNVKVIVYCWEAEGEIEATHIKSEVPKNVEAEEVEFIFRKPGYADSNIIIRNSNFKMDGEDTTLNVTSFQDNVLRALLIDSNMKDEDGQKIPINSVTINNLVPAIARSAVSGVLDHVRL